MSVIRYRLSKQLEFNIRSELNRAFINNGLYLNIASGQFDVTGKRADLLTRVNGNLYESFFDNWVFETDASGVSSFPTILASGVTIDGVFHERQSSPHKPAVDHRNGRVFFEGTAINLNSTVTTEFTAKHVDVTNRDSTAVNLVFSRFKDSVDFTQNLIPSGIQRQLPIVVVDPQTRQSDPFSLGGGNVHDTLVSLHIMSNTNHELSQIVDILTEDYFRKPIKAVDFNKISELFTDKGDRASTYKNFTELQGDSSVSFPTLFIDDARLTEKGELHGIWFARVDWGVKVYKVPTP